MIKKDDYELYFLNDSYDDEIISDTVASFRNRLYYDILAGKKFIENNTLRNGDIKDIVVDKYLNTQYNMPDNSYSLYLNIPIVELYSQREFTTKYDYDTPIPLTTIMKDNKIFSKNILFFIGDFLINNVQIVIERVSNNTIIFIPVGDENGINKDFLNDIITREDCDNSWTISVIEKSDIYYAYSTRASLFSGNKVYLNKLTKVSSYNKPSKSNSWSLYITYNNKAINLLTSTYATLDSDDNGEYFLITDEFKNFIYENSTMMKCIVLNNPSCVGNGIYVNTKSTDPVFRIPYKRNPIPLENITVWKFDASTKRKLHPLEICAELSYPNIYNFKEMIDASYSKTLKDNSKNIVVNSNTNQVPFETSDENIHYYDLYIEWTEPVDDISAFDTYIDDYINCYNDKYVSMVKDGTVHPLVKKYEPISPIDFSPLGYFNSEYKGDFRAWKLDKIIKLSKDNPIRYEELFNKIYQKRKKLASRSYSYNSNPHIYDRSIMDNKFHCDSADEVFTKFNEPHSYIKVYNASCKETGCNLYIDGVLKKITTVTNVGSTLYVYFPCSYIKNRENIHLDIYLDENEIKNHTISLNKRRPSFDFDTYPFNRDESLSNLIFVDNATGLYIGNTDLKLELQIAINDIRYIGLNRVDTISSISTETELWDRLIALTVPTDAEMIILKTAEITHLIENINSQRKINLNNILVTAKNSAVYDKKIGIHTTNFRKVKYFDANNSDVFTLSNYIGKPDSTRFNIFNNGLLVNPSSYTVDFTTYGGDVVFTLNKPITGNIEIEYIGFDRDYVYTGSYGDLNDTNEGLLYLDDFLDTPFDNTVYQIYIDGYRIHFDKIKFISQHSMIKIEDVREYTNDSEVVIIKQRMDKDPYEYETSLEFLSDVSKDDDVFRKYLLDKYDN